MSKTRRYGQAPRLLALLAVMFGLLAMHGLASAHHAAAAATSPVVASAHGLTAAGGEAAGLRRASAPQHGPTGAQPAPPADTEPALRALPQHCHADCVSRIAVLCVVVLTAAIVAVIVLTRRRSVRARATSKLPACSVAGQQRWCPRGKDPVAELCISRT